MGLDATGHYVPASTDAPARSAFDKLSRSLRDPLPVATTAARTALLATLAAASPAVTPSTTSPVFFFRADAAPNESLEATTDGSTFQKYVAAETVVDTSAGGGAIGTSAASATDAAQVTLGAGTWRIDIQSLLTLTPSTARSIYPSLFDGSTDVDVFRINAQADWGTQHFCAAGYVVLASTKTIKLRYIASATGGTQTIGAERLVATRIAGA